MATRKTPRKTTKKPAPTAKKAVKKAKVAKNPAARKTPVKAARKTTKPAIGERAPAKKATTKVASKSSAKVANKTPARTTKKAVKKTASSSAIAKPPPHPPVAQELREAIDLLSDRRSAKRRSGARRLRNLGDPRAGEVLLAALKEEVQDRRTWETQYQMVMALGHVGYRTALPFLETLLDSEMEPMVKMAAPGKLPRTGPV